MKKISLLTAIFLFSMTAASLAGAEQAIREFEGSGEVISSDPLYSRVTIRHDAIKGFTGDLEEEFFVSSSDLLKDISKRDIVDFTIVEEKGDARITKITKTGEAPKHEEKLEIGKAVQGALVTTGEVAKTLTSPITPAHEVVSGATDATTGATGALLEDATTEVKKEF